MAIKNNKVWARDGLPADTPLIQPDTLIVWTEQNGTDMALSFQEPEGCASIW